LVLPKDDVVPGKTWNRKVKESMPGVGTLTLDTLYTDQGTDPKLGLESIGQATKVVLQPPDDAKANPFPLKIKSQDSKGVLHFDGARGHLVDSQANEKVELSAMSMNMEIIQLTETMTARKLIKDEAPK
jgi:hypothetical protein